MVTPSPLAQRAIDRHRNRDADDRLWNVRIGFVRDDLNFGPASDFAFDVRAVTSEIRDDATRARAAAKADLRRELGDWCESYGWDRDTPAQLRREEMRQRMSRAAATAAATARSFVAFGAAARAAAQHTDALAGAMDPLQHVRDLLERQAALEDAIAVNRRAISDVLADAVITSRRE